MNREQIKAIWEADKDTMPSCVAVFQSLTGEIDGWAWCTPEEDEELLCCYALEDWLLKYTPKNEHHKAVYYWGFDDGEYRWELTHKERPCFASDPNRLEAAIIAVSFLLDLDIMEPEAGEEA